MWRIKPKKYNSAEFIVTDEENILVQHVARYQKNDGRENVV